MFHILGGTTPSLRVVNIWYRFTYVLGTGILVPGTCIINVIVNIIMIIIILIYIGSKCLSLPYRSRSLHCLQRPVPPAAAAAAALTSQSAHLPGEDRREI